MASLFSILGGALSGAVSGVEHSLGLGTTTPPGPTKTTTTAAGIGQLPSWVPQIGVPNIVPFGQGGMVQTFGPQPGDYSSSVQQQPQQPPGYTGYITPANGPLQVPNYGNNKAVLASLVLSGKIPAVLPSLRKISDAAPPGYVLVNMGTQKVSVLKNVAYALGLKKKPRRRAILTSKDLQGARRVNHVIQEYSVHRKPKLQLKSGHKKK